MKNEFSSEEIKKAFEQADANMAFEEVSIKKIEQDKTSKIKVLKIGDMIDRRQKR